MKKEEIYFTDGADFVYLPCKEINKKLFNSKVYFRRIVNRYNVETKHISLHDLTACGFKSVKELPKNINDLLDIVLKDI